MFAIFATFLSILLMLALVEIFFRVGYAIFGIEYKHEMPKELLNQKDISKPITGNVLYMESFRERRKSRIGKPIIGNRKNDKRKEGNQFALAN